MALEIGAYISKDLSSYINQWTVTAEFKEIAKSFDLSDELARSLARGARKITDNNLKLITAILKLAITNRNKRHDPLEKAHVEALKTVKHKLNVRIEEFTNIGCLTLCLFKTI